MVLTAFILVGERYFNKLQWGELRVVNKLFLYSLSKVSKSVGTDQPELLVLSQTLAEK